MTIYEHYSFMSTIADVVFQITPAGFTALRSVGNPMDLQLKTLLTLVDGVCPVAQYTPFLLAFAPLPEKFELLERMGYVKRTGTISTQALSQFEGSVSRGTSPSRLPRIDADAQDSGYLRI